MEEHNQNTESGETILIEDNEFSKFTKEQLIRKIKSLVAHNAQLKNIIAKNSDHPAVVQKSQSKPFDFSRYHFRHIALKLLYLGWDYKGYVVQEDTIETIEYYLFEALIKTKLIKDRSSSNYHRCGRTDKGVSSFGQVISIDVRSNLKQDINSTTKEIDYCQILNRVLPDNIQCLAWSPVDQNFSARFDCKSRTYRYYFPKGKLNIERMKMASQKLLGVHDFRNFCKMDVGNGVVEFIRNIFEINIEALVDEFEDYSIFVLQIKSKAFLWHQIRYIMGMLFLIGQGKEDITIIDDLLNIEKNPRKPEYGMASEIPLNLFFCEYLDLTWNYEKETLEKVIQQLNAIWTTHAIKQSMLKDILLNLKTEYRLIQNETSCLSQELLQSAKTKTYIPVMKRHTCDSLEQKIKQFTKRKKTEVKLGIK